MEHSDFWRDKRILVTGGDGFLGRHVVKKIIERKGIPFVPKIEEYDIRKEEDVKKVFENSKPELVIHLAANVGSTSYIKENSAKVYFDNVMMNTLILEYSRIYGVKKFVGIGSAFEYPIGTAAPFKEEDSYSGELEKDSSPYSLTKRMMRIQGQYYREKYGLNAIHIIMTSIYGEGQNIASPIPAMTKRFIDAKINGLESVSVWGTGEATRDFIYIEDAAEGIIHCTESYDSEIPINIGSGREIKIRDLALKIKELTQYSGKIVFDTTKPEGPKRIFLDNLKAQRLGFNPKTNIDTGLKKIIESRA